MKRYNRTLGTAIAGIAMIGSLALPATAEASTKGRLNTTLLLGAAAVYELLNHKSTNALLLGAGTAYAYKQYADSRRNDRRRRRFTYYRYRRYGYRHYGWR